MSFDPYEQTAAEVPADGLTSNQYTVEGEIQLLGQISANVLRSGRNRWVQLIFVGIVVTPIAASALLIALTVLARALGS